MYSVVLPHVFAVGSFVFDPNLQSGDPGVVHACHEIICPVAGAYQASLGRATWRAEPGELLCFPAGTPHRNRTEQDHRCRILLVQWHEAPTDPWPRAPWRLRDGDGHLLALLLRLRALEPMQCEAEDLVRDAALFALLCECRLRLDTGDPADILHRIAAGLQKGLDDRSLNLATMAGWVGMAPIAFLRAFKARIGEPPMAYVRRRRAEAALRMAQNTPLPLAEIARRTGHCDAAHVVRVVKKISGRTPGELRDARRL
jgi:AraC-like DNA-binding protein